MPNSDSTNGKQQGTSLRRSGQQRLDLGIQIFRDFHGASVSIWSEKTGHGVIGKVNSIGPLVNQNCYRRIGAGVGHVLDQLLHDEWVADYETKTMWRFV